MLSVCMYNIYVCRYAHLSPTQLKVCGCLSNRIFTTHGGVYRPGQAVVLMNLWPNDNKAQEAIYV